MTPAPGVPGVDPVAIAGTKRYIAVPVLAAVIGVPISVFAYFFLALVTEAQGWVFADLPDALGFASPPRWWPLLPLAAAGLLVALCIRHLPGGVASRRRTAFGRVGGPRLRSPCPASSWRRSPASPWGR